MSGGDQLIEAAQAVRENAYAPYSRLKVGAAIRAEDGRIFVGANVENASYPEGLCAEAAAIAAMIAAGATRIAAVAVVADADRPVPPCGGCRQRIAEFAGPETEIHLATIAGARTELRFSDLLPHAFTPKHLPVRPSTTLRSAQDEDVS
jgi:cytidine deaminase